MSINLIRIIFQLSGCLEILLFSILYSYCHVHKMELLLYFRFPNKIMVMTAEFMFCSSSQSFCNARYYLINRLSCVLKKISMLFLHFWTWKIRKTYYTTDVIKPQTRLCFILQTLTAILIFLPKHFPKNILHKKGLFPP